MAPPHEPDISDSGERPAAGGEHVTRDAMKVAILKHKADCDLNEKVDKLRLWVAGAMAVVALAAIIGPVWLGVWLNSRLPPQAKASEVPSLINSAHAETKGSTR